MAYTIATLVGLCDNHVHFSATGVKFGGSIFNMVITFTCSFGFYTFLQILKLRKILDNITRLKEGFSVISFGVVCEP